MTDRLTRALFAVLAPIGAVSAALSPFPDPERVAIGGAITTPTPTRR